MSSCQRDWNRENRIMVEAQPPAELLIQAQRALKCAYAPYSKFAVGASLRAANGQLFSGCNVENASYGLTLCAEAGALTALIQAGQKHWSDILIISSGQELCFPCGACRQRLFEFALPSSVLHICTFAGDYKSVSMRELFPFPFGTFNLESS